ncbi:tRNA uridine-5-carboxymethylaminomethyl(34) synthesis GTPase MnmE [Aquabacterium sp.]|uniref:tRNA uridine-5-carboxymethylaminomethyl(34) synthesis GTPase MnmE n=1 Tax=Aquabacterium sp. TaxID=1872578 RepID=UPI002E3547DC|nr:tRNA uridine-5-carboxymethylaminomethyl(34) synthesis GTPase MnmE [Aquabacterium sp.]HEX5311132.1 tRNA uridine-5-carboxymethylaminomethyl(34) synthesis GTPase MnmE [Aquabacterium sp.]
MAWSERTQPIVAIATASGRGAVGIVRVSGKGLSGLIQALVGRELPPRQAVYGPFRDGHGEAIDHGLALFFPGPHSYTGEDVLELQGHGGPVVMQLLLARCLEAAAEADPGTGRARLPGLRLAEPGEFTQRAFLNDKIDLAQAEAIADLIDASTEAAARSASRSLGGVFSKEIDDLRDRMINLRMLVEATLDFPEEEIDFLEKADARGKLQRIADQLDTVLGQAKQGALLREGLQVVLAGQPNAGKSSLLNALAGAELAIVTPIAGTTRDKVSETIQIEGVPLHVIDTAGLRADHEATDEVERIGMARSWEAIEGADAVLFLHDLTRLDEAVYAAADADIATRLPSHVPVVHVFNKVDAPGAATVPALAEGQEWVALSARTGQGLEALRQTLLRLAGWQAAQEGVFIARQRHVQSLRLAREHVETAQAHAALADGALDLMAEELRLAHNALGTITGAFSSDDLLGEIFTRFCIGK